MPNTRRYKKFQNRRRNSSRSRSRGRSQSPYPYGRGRSSSRGRSNSRGRPRSNSQTRPNNNAKQVTFVAPTNDTAAVTTARNGRGRGKQMPKVPAAGLNIGGTDFNRREARMLLTATGKAPPEICFMTEPNTILVTSDVNTPQWWSVFSAEIISHQANKPNMRPPQIVAGPVSVDWWSGVMAYYWWAMMAKWQDPEVGVLVSSAANNLTTFAVPPFPAKNRLPTAVLKFIETFLPSCDSVTKAKVQFEYKNPVQPVFSVAHLTPTGVLAGSDFSFCPFAQFLCRTNAVGPNSENTFQRYSITATMQNVYQQAAQFERYHEMLGVTGTYVDLPNVCSMATAQVMIYTPVALGNNMFRIVSSCANYDAELACIFFGVVNTTPVDSPSFMYETPMPITDTNIPSQFDPSKFLEMTLVFTYLCQSCMYVRGGLQNLLSNSVVHPKVHTIQPRYYNIDLSQYHRLQSQVISVVAATLPALTAAQIYAALITWEAAMLSRLMPFAYPGLAIYSKDNTGSGEIIDMASTTFVNGTFGGIPIPGTLALWLDQMNPIFIANGGDRKGECVYIPLFDSTSPLAPQVYYGIAPVPSPPVGLPAGISQWSGRWVGISSPSGVLVNGNYATYSLYNTSTSLPLAPKGFYQFDLFLSVAQFYIVGGVNINPSTIAVSLSSSTPQFPPMTPDRLASNFIEMYNSTFGGFASNFLVPSKLLRGSSVVAAQIISTTSAIGKPIITNVIRYVQVRPTMVGSYEPLDGPSAALALFCAFKTISTLDMMPYKVTNSENGDVSLAMTEFVLMSGSAPTSFIQIFQAHMNRGEPTNVALQAAVEDILDALFKESPPGIAYHKKDAILKYVKASQRIKSSTHFPTTAQGITAEHSWSDISKFFKGVWQFSKQYVLPVAQTVLPLIAAAL